MGRILTLTVVLAGMLLVGCTSRIAGPTAPSQVVGSDGSLYAPGDGGGTGNPPATELGDPGRGAYHMPRPLSAGER